MIGAALVFQIAAILCFAIWSFQNKPTVNDATTMTANPPLIKTGQVYEFLITGDGEEPSQLSFRKVLDVRHGHVKYLASDTPAAFTGPEHVTPVKTFRYARIVSSMTNPFVEETKQ